MEEVLRGVLLIDEAAKGFRNEPLFGFVYEIKSSWSPCGDPFPNKPTPHGDPLTLRFFTNLFATLIVRVFVAASLRADPFPN